MGAQNSDALCRVALSAAALGALGFGASADAKGTFTTFDPRGSINTYAIGINGKGAIAGFYQGRDYARHGFVRLPDGSITVFDAPGSGFTTANNINDEGVITGWCGDAQGYHGFVRAADGTITAFDPPGSSATYAFGLNDKGTIAGWWYKNFNQAQH